MGEASVSHRRSGAAQPQSRACRRRTLIEQAVDDVLQNPATTDVFAKAVDHRASMRSRVRRSHA